METFDEQTSDDSTRSTLKSGANWFFWVAILSVINSLIVFYFGTNNFLFALGFTQWADGTAGAFTNQGLALPLSSTSLVIDLLIAAGFAGFGYFARKGNDLAFVFGMFIYVVDAMLVLGLKDFFGFGFHLLPLFFIFKGLLASRHLRENATTI